MTDAELQKLIDEAKECYESKKYEQELELWESISDMEPNNPLWKHNIAFALMNTGRLIEALELFNFLAESHPYLSRVHNNRAILLMRLGMDLKYLIPVFGQALAASRDLEDFMRSFINLCATAAFGLDERGNEALDQIKKVSFGILKKGSPPEQFKKNKVVLMKLLVAYKHIGVFREALTARKWRVAETELNAAERKFRDLQLGAFASYVKHVQRTARLCRNVVAIIEEFGTDPSVSPDSILKKFERLLQAADSLAETEKEVDSTFRLLDILGFFLSGIVVQLRFLAKPVGEGTFKNASHAAINRLASVSFIDLGRILSSLLQFIDRQCTGLMRLSTATASGQIILKQRDDAWARIAFFCNGLAFDFSAINVAVAREALGWPHSPLEDARREIQHFRSFVERQAYKDIFVAGHPQENIARSLLQAFLTPRSYREVPVRGGQTDLLLFTKNGRFLYETKIWRGSGYYRQGLRALEEYIIGESDDESLAGIFYLIFDPTASQQAQSYLRSTLSTSTVGGRSVDVIIINLTPASPSKKRR